MKLILLLTLFISNSLIAKEISENQIKQYEQNFKKLIDKEKLSQDKKLYLYLIAARDFHSYNLQSYYLKYLNLAKDTESTEPKVEVYWRLINAYLKDDNWSQATKIYSEWNQTNEKVSDYQKQLFQLLEMKLLKRKHTSFSPAELKKINQSMNSFQFNSYKLDQLIIAKEYEKALLMINPKELDQQMISSIVRFDLLSRLVKGKNATKPRCSKLYYKYPASPSYSIQTCKALIEIDKDGKISPGTLDKVKKTFSMDIFKKESFLYDALLNVRS